MEAVRTSETSVDNHFTRQYNPEDSSELVHSSWFTHKFIYLFICGLHGIVGVGEVFRSTITIYYSLWTLPGSKSWLAFNHPIEQLFCTQFVKCSEQKKLGLTKIVVTAARNKLYVQSL
jgi:hypothetical protein